MSASMMRTWGHGMPFPRQNRTLCCPIWRGSSATFPLKCYWKKGAAKRNSPYTLALQEVEECLPDRKSAEEEVEARELARVIACFLDTLSAENRVIFMRRYWFSDSCRDIAGLVGLSEKNISRPADPDPKEAETISGRKRGVFYECKEVF